LYAWLFASLSTKALRELKREGIVQAWGEKTSKSIKLKVY
jgi:ribosomal protein S25